MRTALLLAATLLESACGIPTDLLRLGWQLVQNLPTQVTLASAEARMAEQAFAKVLKVVILKLSHEGPDLLLTRKELSQDKLLKLFNRMNLKGFSIRKPRDDTAEFFVSRHSLY